MRLARRVGVRMPVPASGKLRAAASEVVVKAAATALYRHADQSALLADEQARVVEFGSISRDQFYMSSVIKEFLHVYNLLHRLSLIQ